MSIGLIITIGVLYILDKKKYINWHLKNVIKMSVLIYVITLFGFSIEISLITSIILMVILEHYNKRSKRKHRKHRR
jgi:hypothetical protein